MSSDTPSGGDLDFERLVSRYYTSLYQFGLSLTRSEDEAGELTQQTFHTWALKGHQLRDAAKVKTWLFTTLHREFLQRQRRSTRFKHFELGAVDHELPNLAPRSVSQMDCAAVLQALAALDEVFQAPVALFYLEDCSYKEIAEILEIPLGTVKSRIARGIDQLQQRLLDHVPAGGPTKKA
ncbi:MAG TPA: RNA polymerase sigma factor [Verrucomicrobiae bacterium]|nr:RNA polymerase sigma factor [Verrucomicrobiae bacterium]